MFIRLSPQLLSCSLHTSPSLHLAAAAAATKSSLGKLRKKTGYSLSICKKALEESGQDMAKAELWLREQAQAQGWAKAQKLEGRNTQQGLLGVQVVGDKAALVELNCETDFVARNAKFHSLLQVVASTCINKPIDGDGTEHVVQTSLTKEAMCSLPAGDGKTLADVVALNIGQLGENIVLGGATLLQVRPGAQLAGLTHPSASIHQNSEKLQYGRYGAIMAYTGQETEQAATLARQVCQHIIGMAPTHINNEDDKENSLVHQPFLLDEEMKTGDILKSEGVQIEAFVRVEVGKTVEE